MALNNVDLPTLGKPIRADLIFIEMVCACLIFCDGMMRQMVMDGIKDDHADMQWIDATMRSIMQSRRIDDIQAGGL